jgi:hypothetical protein
LPFPRAARLYGSASGGRTWWAHFEFTRINIEPIILRKKIEDLREVRGGIAKHYGVIGE